MIALSSTAQAVAKEARGLLSQGWTQDAYARDKEGLVVPLACGHATCFCMSGAMFRQLDYDAMTLDELGFKEAHKALKTTVTAISGDESMMSVPHYNDDPDRTQDEVLAVFDKVLAA